MKKVLLLDEEEVVSLRELVSCELRRKGMYYDGMLGPEFASQCRTAKEINWAVAMYNILQNLRVLEDSFKQKHIQNRGGEKKNITLNVLMFKK